FGAGILSDKIGRKPPIVAGMGMLGVGILAFGLGHAFAWWMVTAGIMGLGMALLYPNLNAAVADVAPPQIRGGVLGVYRLWRDGGYAIGGLLLGVTSRSLGMLHSVDLIGVIALISMAVLLFRMQETHPQMRKTGNTEEGEGAFPSA
ncbi:MAG: MFS transporter, partial [Bacilli bacterium]